MTQTSEAVDSARVLEHFRLRERQCLVEHRAYSKWLAPLTPLRWITVIGGIALSGLAGIIVLLCEYQRLSNDWRPTGGIFALVATIFTAADHVPYVDPALPRLVLRRIRVSVWLACEGTWRLSERTLGGRNEPSTPSRDVSGTEYHPLEENL